MLSEIEDARTLQYQCECVETACLEQGTSTSMDFCLRGGGSIPLTATMTGLDFNEPRVKRSLGRYFCDSAPDDFEAWLDRNLSQLDPVVRGWRSRDLLPLRHRSSASHKCWDDRCLHYIYGFPSEDERDQHTKDHSTLLKRDSGLSLGLASPLTLQDHSAYRRDPNNDRPRPSPPLCLPRPTGSLQLAKPPVPGLLWDRKDSLKSYSLAPEPSGLKREVRSSIDSEVDPLLPPLKRSRVGQSRLESIGELRLQRDDGACLRCRVLHKAVSPRCLHLTGEQALIVQCDSNNTCSSCSGPSMAAFDDLWTILGCYRGSFTSLAEILLPGLSTI